MNRYINLRTMALAGALLVVAVSLVGGTPPEPPQTGSGSTSVEGVVVDWSSRNPIAGVEVELTRVEGTDAFPLTPGTPAAAAPDGPGPAVLSIYAMRLPLTPAADEVLPHAVTSDDGTFVFRGVKPGQYRLAAAQSGGAYTPAEYGQRDPRGRGIAFPVAAGQAIKGLRLEMAHTGAIAGRVRDENGDPMGRATVLAFEPQYQDGHRMLNIVQVVHADERGDYRLYWLPPGRYYVSAKPEDPLRRNSPDFIVPPGASGTHQRALLPVVIPRILPTGESVEETYASVYYGGVVDPDKALPVEVVAGKTVNGTDIAMGAGKTRAHHIRGTVTNANGSPSSVAVKATRLQSSADNLVLTGQSDAQGAFDLPGAAPGAYVVVANGGIASRPFEVGNSDVNDVRIAAVTSANFQGRLNIEGRLPDANDPDRARMKVLVRKLEGGWGPAAGSSDTVVQVLASGAFTIPLGSRIGYFRADVWDLPAGMYIKSIRMGAVDVLSEGLEIFNKPTTPMEIEIGVNGGAVSGAAVDSKMAALPHAIVALVPNSLVLRRRTDLYRSAVTGANGQFKLQGITPGDYKLFAWEYADADAWQNAEFLKPYEGRGEFIHIDAGGKQEMRITASPARQ